MATGGRYFQMWQDDARAMLMTMARNLSSDLLAGYNPAGQCIRRQVEDLAAYRVRYERRLEELKMLAGADVEKWCRADLRRRGAIS